MAKLNITPRLDYGLFSYSFSSFLRHLNTIFQQQNLCIFNIIILSRSLGLSKEFLRKNIVESMEKASFLELKIKLE